MLVGAKSDKTAERQVSTQEGQEKATQLGCLFAEVTATDGSTITNAFNRIVEEMNTSHEPEPVKQSSCC